MPGKNWKKPVEQRHKHLSVSKEFERLRTKEYELIDSEEGKKLQMNRGIQVEGSFGDMKADSSFRRFLCRGKQSVYNESSEKKRGTSYQNLSDATASSKFLSICEFRYSYAPKAFELYSILSHWQKVFQASSTFCGYSSAL